MDPLLHQTIKQRYVVEKGPLGETGEADAGGWSDVYLARDQDVGGRRVILKFPKEALLQRRDGTQFRARFRREISTLLASGEGFPGVVPVLDAGEHAGRPYCVLMYIRGGSLEGRLTRREASRDGTVRRVEVRQTPAEIAAWLPAVARSIDTVHGRGIVHRDIKPANILFGDDDTPYLSDFGIARLVEGGGTTAGITGTARRNAFYTPGYESPEFIEGLPADFGYDHYALAVVVFRALTGRLPHWPTDPRIEDRHRALASRRTREDAEDVRALQPQISARVAAVVAKALSRRQLDRYPSCAAFASAFDAAVSGRVAPAERVPDEVTRGAPPLSTSVAVRARTLRPLPKPSWAKTSVEQDAYAKQARVPVWHETDLGGGEALRFVLVPPGTFVMGSPTTEAGRDANETLHEVTLTRGYYLSIGEVTNGQYRRWSGAHRSGTIGEKRLNEPAQPVVMVSHDDATAFAAWLSAQDPGRTYRLPTEAEWEYACRAGATTPFWFGATITPAQANYDGSFAYGRGPKGANRQQTTPWRTFPPNRWGLYGLHGNVWEWCADWYGAYPAGRVQDPPGPPIGRARVLRGGSWRYGPAYVRSASRRRATPDVRDDDCGFRLVLVAPRG